jgi:hypothetical protein
LKASVCCVHSLFLWGISAPRISSYPSYTCLTQNGNTVFRLRTFKIIFWMRVTVVESSSSSPPPPLATSLLHNVTYVYSRLLDTLPNSLASLASFPVGLYTKALLGAV